MKKTACLVLAIITVLSSVILGASYVSAGVSGDVNGDGETDNKDVVTLFRYVSSGGTSDLEKSCDINGDGMIDNKDVVTLFRAVSGSEATETEEIAHPENTTLLNSVEYDAKGIHAAFSDPEFKAKLSSFSNKLYEISAENNDGNYAVSPLSAYMAFAILNAVGDDGIHSDIEALFGMTQEDIEKTKQLFLSLVNERSVEGQLLSKLDLANTVWIDNGRTVYKQAVDMLAEKLFCYVHSTPFWDDNAGANKAIREFIADKTNGLIDTDFDLDPDTAFAIINTLYLKDIWGENDLSISQRTFSSNGKQYETDFLTTEYICGEVAETRTAEYFTVQTECGYKVKFILPKDGYTLKQAMTADLLDEINARQSYTVDHGDEIDRYTRCIFPKFRIESDTDLKEILSENGYLQNAFTGYTSCLMDSVFSVTDIIHKVVLNVDEKGVEGAAVTIIESKDTAIMLPDEKYCKDFVLDREFGFIITTYDNVILFEGTVVEP